MSEPAPPRIPTVIDRAKRLDPDAWREGEPVDPERRRQSVEAAHRERQTERAIPPVLP